MPNATVKSHSDAWVAQDAQHHNNGKGERLWVRGTGSTAARHTFVSFARPFDENDALVVVSATLHLWLKDSWASTQVVSARRVTDTWKEDRITWANEPTNTTADEASATVTSGSDKDPVDIDVTDIMQAVAAGGDFYGFRLELDDNVKRSFRSSDTSFDAFHPQLEVVWGYAPYPPTDLKPAGGKVVSIATPTLSWRYPDRLQETTQASSRVQISDSTSFTSPLYDSTMVSNTISRWNLAGEYTVADGASRYWRVQTLDDGGRASGWSDTEHFSRDTKGTILLVNPGISETVQDLTPTFEWTFTGETQDQVELQVFELADNGTVGIVYEFDRRKYADDHLTLPRRHKHPQIRSGHNYQVWLRIWDDQNREDTSRDPAYAVAYRNFTYIRDGTPSPVTSITSEVVGPGVTLTWVRAATPDWFCLRANGEEVIHRIEPTDVATATPAEYQFTYWEAKPGTEVVYEVEAVEAVAGKYVHSDGNPTTTETTETTGVWLIDDDADDAIRFDANVDTPDISIGESATTFNPVGNQVPVRITDAVRGYEGSLGGMLASRSDRNIFLDLKGRDKELRVVISDLNFPVWLEEVSVSPVSLPNDHRYQVSFAFFQSDEYDI